MNDSLDIVLKQMNYKSMMCPLCCKTNRKCKYLYYHCYYTCQRQREFIDRINDAQVIVIN